MIIVNATVIASLAAHVSDQPFGSVRDPGRVAVESVALGREAGRVSDVILQIPQARAVLHDSAVETSDTAYRLRRTICAVPPGRSETRTRPPPQTSKKTTARALARHRPSFENCYSHSTGHGGFFKKSLHAVEVVPEKYVGAAGQTIPRRIGRNACDITLPGARKFGASERRYSLDSPSSRSSSGLVRRDFQYASRCTNLC